MMMIMMTIILTLLVTFAVQSLLRLFKLQKFQNIALQRCFSVYIGSQKSTFRDTQSVPFQGSRYCLILEDGTKIMSRNVGNKQPIYAAKRPNTAKVS
jgi:hypothetical protein